jgi:VanZ family protein
LTEPVIILTQSEEVNESMDQGSSLRRWFPALIIMGVIFLASSIPADLLPNAGKFDLPVKKTGHFTGYALLALGIMRGLQNGKPKKWYLVLLFCGLYAVSDEFHQSFVSGRHPSPIDVGIDLLGSSFGLMLFLWLTPLRRLVLK